MRRSGIAPGHIPDLLARPRNEIPVARNTFELAKGSSARACLQPLHPYIGWSEVIDRRVAGFQDAQTAAGLRQHDAGLDYAKMTRGLLQTWRPRVVPYRLMPDQLYIRHGVFVLNHTVNRSQVRL